MRLFLLTMLAFLLASAAFAQKKHPVKAVPKKPAVERQVPGYKLFLKIAPKGRMYVSMATEPTGEIGIFSLQQLITDLPTGADRLNKPNNVFPFVIVQADPEVSMLDLWEPIKLFRRGTDIHLWVPNGIGKGDPIDIAVPWEEPERNEIEVKPNPLTLIVRVSEDGTLLLNNEPNGTLGNTRPLTDRLKGVFHDREINGVFRPQTNEVEKSVAISLPVGDRKVSDLITIARAIWLPGGDRISLVMGESPDGSTDVRKTILDVLPEPPKKKPHR
jgi:biopolymer transport protein ExbD